MYVDASQSMYEHSIIDYPKHDAWFSLAMEILTLNDWMWLHENSLGFTFQSAQHRLAWSRLGGMYVMHDDYFFTSINFVCKFYKDVGTSNHFTICLDVCSHAIDMHKSLFRKSSLRLN